MTKAILTQEKVKELLSYDLETGDLTRKVITSNRVKIGDFFGSAGRHDRKVYRRGNLNGTLYYAHRLIWLYMTGALPDNDIDHIDGDGLNNKWVNLRAVTRTENRLNCRKPENNTSNCVGVNWFKRAEMWTAVITKDRKTNRLGYFDDWFEAVCARKSAENKYGFHPNHGTTRPL